MEKPPSIITIQYIYTLLNLLTKISRQDLDHRLVANNAKVTRLQYVVIRFLSHQHFTIRELSHKLICEPATLVPVVDHLEKKGLVIRTNDPKDRRRNPLVLTEEGLEVLRSVEPYHPENTLVKGLTQLGPEKTQQLRDLLHELTTSVVKEEDIQHAVMSWQVPIIDDH